MFKRDYYLNKLIERKNSSKIKIITELRRSGKSYLLNKEWILVISLEKFLLDLNSLYL